MAVASQLSKVASFQISKKHAPIKATIKHCTGIYLIRISEGDHICSTSRTARSGETGGTLTRGGTTISSITLIKLVIFAETEDIVAAMNYGQ